MTTKAVNILYVEDDAMDVHLAKTALGFVCTAANLTIDVVEDGEQALQFLNRAKPYDNAVIPDVILLDLNLPKIPGLEVLRSIKLIDSLKKIPVIVLTTSQLQDDVDKSYALGASGYLTKPGELAEYKDTFKAICDFWFRKVSLPTRVASGA